MSQDTAGLHHVAPQTVPRSVGSRPAQPPKGPGGQPGARQTKGKQEPERPTGLLHGWAQRAGPGPGRGGSDPTLGLVTMEVGPGVIPRLRPQNPMGAGDQTWAPPSTSPTCVGTVLGKCVITKIITVAFRKHTGLCWSGIVLRSWRSSCRRKPCVVPLNQGGSCH